MFKDKDGNQLSTKDFFDKVLVRLSNYFIDFCLMILRFVGHIPSHNIRKLSYLLSGMKIGRGSTIHVGANFFYPKGITIGEDTIVGMGAFIDGREKVVIGNHVDIASEVMIYNSEHDLESETFKAVNGKVEIGDYVFVGPRAIILPNVKIGRGAVVAAGAVVSHDIDDFSIVGGVPAKVIGQRKNKNPHYRLGRARLFQ